MDKATRFEAIYRDLLAFYSKFVKMGLMKHFVLFYENIVRCWLDAVATMESTLVEPFEQSLQNIINQFEKMQEQLSSQWDEIKMKKFYIYLLVKLHDLLWQQLVKVDQQTIYQAPALIHFLICSRKLHLKMIEDQENLNWKVFDTPSNTNRYYQNIFFHRYGHVLFLVGDLDQYESLRIFLSTNSLTDFNAQNADIYRLATKITALSSLENETETKSEIFCIRCKSMALKDIGVSLVSLIKSNRSIFDFYSFEFDQLPDTAATESQQHSALPTPRKRSRRITGDVSTQDHSCTLMSIAEDYLNRFDLSIALQNFYEKIKILPPELQKRFHSAIQVHSSKNWVDCIRKNMGFEPDQCDSALVWNDFPQKPMNLLDWVSEFFLQYQQYPGIELNVYELLEFAYEHGLISEKDVFFLPSIIGSLNFKILPDDSMFCRAIQLEILHHPEWQLLYDHQMQFLLHKTADLSAFQYLNGDSVFNHQLAKFIQKVEKHTRNLQYENYLQNISEHSTPEEIVDYLLEAVIPEFPCKLDIIGKLVFNEHVISHSSLRPVLLALMEFAREEEIFWLTQKEDLFPDFLRHLIVTHHWELELTKSDLKPLAHVIENSILKMNCTLLPAFLNMPSKDVSNLFQWTNSNKEILITKKSPLFNLLLKYYETRIVYAQKLLEYQASSNPEDLFKSIWNFSILPKYSLLQFQSISMAEEAPIENSHQLTVPIQNAFLYQFQCYSLHTELFEKYFILHSSAYAHIILDSFEMNLVKSEPLYPFQIGISLPEKEIHEFLFINLVKIGGCKTFDDWIQKFIYKRDWHIASSLKEFQDSVKSLSLRESLPILLQHRQNSTSSALKTNSLKFWGILWMKVLTLCRLFKYKRLDWQQLVDLSRSLEILYFMPKLEKPQNFLIIYFWVRSVQCELTTLLVDGLWTICPRLFGSDTDALSRIHTIVILFSQLASHLSKSDFKSHIMELEVIFYISLTAHPLKIQPLNKDIIRLLVIPFLEPLAISKPDLYLQPLLVIFWKIFAQNINSTFYQEKFHTIYRTCLAHLQTSVICDESLDLAYKVLSIAFKAFKKTNAMLEFEGLERMLVTESRTTVNCSYLDRLLNTSMSLSLADKKKYHHQVHYLISTIHLHRFTLSQDLSDLELSFKALLPLFAIKVTESGQYCLSTTANQVASGGVPSSSPICKIWKSSTEPYGLHYYFLWKYTVYLIEDLLKRLALSLPEKYGALLTDMIKILKKKERGKNTLEFTNPYSKQLENYVKHLTPPSL
jgi:flagellin-specific chaperone FliS